MKLERKEQRRVTPEMGKEIRRMLLDGDRHIDIGVALDIDPSTVSQYKKKHKIVVPKRKKMSDEPCSESGCNRPAQSKGYCGSHYNKYKALGVLTKGQYHRAAVKIRLPSSLRPRCNHKTSACDCRNIGRQYHEYLKVAGMKIN